MIIDSGEDTPTGYQKIPCHWAFDAEYGIIHETRLVSGTNWTLNDKEKVYPGDFHMDNVMIRFFLGELYGISCCVFEMEMTSHGKNKVKNL
jgi:hypothetical protein